MTPIGMSTYVPYILLHDGLEGFSMWSDVCAYFSVLDVLVFLFL